MVGWCLLLQGPAQPPPPQRPDYTGSHSTGSRGAQSLLSISPHSSGAHWVPAQGSPRAGLKRVFPQQKILSLSSIPTPSGCQGDAVGVEGVRSLVAELGVSITRLRKSRLPSSGRLSCSSLSPHPLCPS